MRIYNTDIFEKLKIKPVNVNDLSVGSTSDSTFKIIKDVVRDNDGNSYDGIEVEDKIWMASNLRVTHFGDGMEIGNYNESKQGSLPYMECPDVDISKIKDYGLYYNFEAINRVDLIPDGWDIPTFEDWTDLFKCVVRNKEYNLTPNEMDISKAYIAKSICSVDGWKESDTFGEVGCDSQTNNKTGFNIFPAGFCNPTGAHCLLNECTSFWTMSKSAPNRFFDVTFSYEEGAVYKGSSVITYGLSVRCVKYN